MQVVSLFGPPLAGKGTQENNFINAGFAPISPGAVLREKIAQGDPKYLAAAEAINSGGLAPDELVAEIINDFIEEKMRQGFKGVLLDGSPRTLNQALVLDEFLAAKGLKLKMIELVIDDPEAVRSKYHTGILNDRRLKRIKERQDQGLPPRPDDVAEVFRKRMDNYDKFTVPVADYYSAQGCLHRIDGMQSPGAVWNDIDRIINPMPAVPPPRFGL